MENQSLYYILDGQIECYLNLGKNITKTIKNLNSKEYLGEFSFFSCQKEKFSARTKTFTTVLKLDFSDFYETLQEFQDDFVKFFYKNYLIFFRNPTLQ